MKENITVKNGNLKVLGLVIRSKRIEKGLSLRDMSAITLVSHSLISNIEKGIQTPNKETLKSIMENLDLRFYNDPAMMDEMTNLSRRFLSLLENNEYEQAKVVYNKIIEKEDIYLYSPQLVNYILVKYLFIAMTNVQDTDIDDMLSHYKGMLEFFTELQQQAYYFIEGLNHLNNERYNKSLSSFTIATNRGDKYYDVYIKEYMVISMVRQFKFMDSFRIANEIITEFEKRTIYYRAMKVKLQLARVNLVIMKFDDMRTILDQVYNFASKFEVMSLLEEVLLLRAAIEIKLNNLEEAENYISQMPYQKSISSALLRFRIAYIRNQPLEIEKLYLKVMKYPEVKNHYKLPGYFTVLTMYKVPSLMDEDKYLESLTKMVDDAVENNDQEIIGLGFNYLFEYYSSKRQYKKATDVAKEFLQHKRILRKL